MWVVLQVCRGKEMDVKWVIDDTAKTLKDSGNLIIEALAPVRKVAVHSSRSIMLEPVIKGYVFVSCRMTSHLWHYLKSIPFVIRILDGYTTDEEISRLLPHIKSVVELKTPDRGLLGRVKKKYLEFIETRRKKKDVIRLPLEAFKSLFNSAGLLFPGKVTEKTMFRFLLEGP